MNIDVKHLAIVCGTIAFTTLVGCVAYYEVKRDELMSRNIESAIVKGVDPMAARCSYSKPTDTICVVYASGTHRPDAPTLSKR
jgi:hypothetical protein